MARTDQCCPETHSPSVSERMAQGMQLIEAAGVEATPRPSMPRHQLPRQDNAPQSLGGRARPLGERAAAGGGRARGRGGGGLCGGDGR